jgi:hypothetical protein
VQPHEAVSQAVNMLFTVASDRRVFLDTWNVKKSTRSLRLQKYGSSMPACNISGMS